MATLLAWFFIFALASVALFFICIPIMIANVRGITGTEKTTIIILSWFGILFGVTWVVALVLSLLWRGSAPADSESLDKLEKIAGLYKDKTITKPEYEKLKAKVFSEIGD
jgi:hypothetical protein